MVPQSSLSARAASHHHSEPEGRQEAHYNLYISKQIATQTDTALLPEHDVAREARRPAGWLSGQDKWCRVGKDGSYHSPSSSRSYLHRSFCSVCKWFSVQQFGHTSKECRLGWSTVAAGQSSVSVISVAILHVGRNRMIASSTSQAREIAFSL